MVDLELGKKLSDCAMEYANAAISALKLPGGVHPPTVIAACARMAGTSLFRSFALHLPNVQPGQAVLSAEADQHSAMLLRTAAGILANLGIRVPSSPSGELVDDKAKPMHDFLQTQRLLEPLFLAIQAKYALSARHASQAAAIATALLIHHFAKNIAPSEAFGLAAFSFVEGCRTAPEPVTLGKSAA
jgi:hypothetical protein